MKQAFLPTPYVAAIFAAATALTACGGNDSSPLPAPAPAPAPVGDLPNMIPAGYMGTPFGGTPQVIPGRIEIESYDLGGANVAYLTIARPGFDKCGFKRSDSLDLQCTQQPGVPDKSLPGCSAEPAGQVYLGYINTGDWYKYTVDVPDAGTYAISGHQGVAGTGPKMQFTFTEAAKTGSVALRSTDLCNHEAYHVWEVQDNLGEIVLQPGRYVLTIKVVQAGMNLDWFAFTKK